MDNLVNLASSGAPIDDRNFFSIPWRMMMMSTLLWMLKPQSRTRQTLDSEGTVRRGIRESLHDEVECSVEHSTTDTTISYHP